MAKIMLVEDDTSLLEIYEAKLQADGYDVVTARDGEEALTVALKEKPDLIIADVMMPKVSGFDMVDILRSTPETKNTKIIMMTALSQAEDKLRAEKLGADKYLVKSQVTLEDVTREVREILGAENAELEAKVAAVENSGNVAGTIPTSETPTPDSSPTPTSEPTPNPEPTLVPEEAPPINTTPLSPSNEIPALDESPEADVAPVSVEPADSAVDVDDKANDTPQDIETAPETAPDTTPKQESSVPVVETPAEVAEESDQSTPETAPATPTDTKLEPKKTQIIVSDPDSDVNTDKEIAKPKTAEDKAVETKSQADDQASTTTQKQSEAPDDKPTHEEQTTEEEKDKTDSSEENLLEDNEVKPIEETELEEIDIIDEPESAPKPKEEEKDKTDSSEENLLEDNEVTAEDVIHIEEELKNPESSNQNTPNDDSDKNPQKSEAQKGVAPQETPPDDPFLAQNPTLTDSPTGIESTNPTETASERSQKIAEDAVNSLTKSAKNQAKSSSADVVQPDEPDAGGTKEKSAEYLSHQDDGHEPKQSMSHTKRIEPTPQTEQDQVTPLEDLISADGSIDSSDAPPAVDTVITPDPNPSP